MNNDNKSKAELMKQWRERKKQSSRESSKLHYEKNKGNIIKKRKIQELVTPESDDASDFSGEPTEPESSFPSRMAKKRAIAKAKKALPESPRKRAEVLTTLLDSPNTRKSLPQSVALNTPEQQDEVRLAKAVISDVSTALDSTKHKRSDGARTAMHVGLSMLCGASIGQGNMRKRLADALNINRRRVAMSVQQEKRVLCDTAALWELTKRRTRCDAIPDEHKKLAQEFWSSPGVSRTTGNKKDVKRERIGPKQYVSHEKHILEKTQTEVYKEFKEMYPDVRMGQRAFEKCKPFYVVEARPRDRESCCSRAHVEIRMLFKACMSFRREVLKGKPDGEKESFPIYEHLTDLVEETMCDRGDASYHRLSCINRQCEECGTGVLKLMPEEEDTSPSASKVNWQRFEYVALTTEKEEKRRLKIVTKNTTAGEMFGYFKVLLDSFTAHQFRAKWQLEQMKKTVDSLPAGHVCCVHDYSENYSCQYQDQIQSLYFSQAQASIHVTILHRHAIKEIDGIASNEETPEIVTEHLFVISPDIKHDHDSVHECRAIVADYLKDINYPITVMHEWTDGCASQYKSCHCMGDVSYSVADFGFLTLRNYFETSHAKGPQDGAGANLKHKTDMAVIKRQVVIQNAHDLYNYAKENLTEPSSTRYKSQSVGLKRRLFFYVEQHRRNRHGRRFKQIKGSRQIHSIMATEDRPGLKIKSRLLSCYCDSCIDGEYEDCLNQDWIQPWEDIELEADGISRRVTRGEIGEQRTAVKDLITEGSVVAIASGDPGEDYYLLKVTGQGVDSLRTQTKDDWAASYPAGAEIICGHFLLPSVAGRSNRQYKVDQSRKAIVYATTARFLCTDLCSLPGDIAVVSEQEHLDILNSLDGF